MQYFTEQAPSHKEAIDNIRLKYGQQARILTHRRVKMGGFLGMFRKEGVEVTGFVADNSSKKGSVDMQEEKRKILDNLKGDTKMLETLLNEVREIKDRVNNGENGKREMHPTLGKIENLMIQNDFSPDYIDSVITRCRKTFSLEELEDYRTIEKSVVRWIGESVGIHSLEIKEKNPNIAILVGPTGVGKTTTIAKLAAIYGIGTAGSKPVNVRMLTADNYRIGAKKQLETYGDIMGIPVSGSRPTRISRKNLQFLGMRNLFSWIRPERARATTKGWPR